MVSFFKVSTVVLVAEIILTLSSVAGHNKPIDGGAPGASILPPSDINRTGSQKVPSENDDVGIVTSLKVKDGRHVCTISVAAETEIDLMVNTGSFVTFLIGQGCKGKACEGGHGHHFPRGDGPIGNDKGLPTPFDDLDIHLGFAEVEGFITKGDFKFASSTISNVKFLVANEIKTPIPNVIYADGAIGLGSYGSERLGLSIYEQAFEQGLIKSDVVHFYASGKVEESGYLQFGGHKRQFDVEIVGETAVVDLVKNEYGAWEIDGVNVLYGEEALLKSTKAYIVSSSLFNFVYEKYAVAINSKLKGFKVVDNNVHVAKCLKRPEESKAEPVKCEIKKGLFPISGDKLVTWVESSEHKGFCYTAFQPTSNTQCIILGSSFVHQKLFTYQWNLHTLEISNVNSNLGGQNKGNGDSGTIGDNHDDKDKPDYGHGSPAKPGNGNDKDKGDKPRDRKPENGNNHDDKDKPDYGYGSPAKLENDYGNPSPPPSNGERSEVNDESGNKQSPGNDVTGGNSPVYGPAPTTNHPPSPGY